MNPKINNLQKHIDRLLKDYDKNQARMEELLKDPKVKEFYDCYYENDKLSRLLADAKEDLEFEKMRNCIHSFIQKKVNMNSELTYNYCPICGVNNRAKVINPTMENASYHDQMVVSIYKETAKNGMFPVNIYDQNKKSSK